MTGGAPAAPRPRILVIDDEAAIREVLERLLAQQGYDVVAAADAAAASALIAADHFDAIVTDVRMPGVSGLDLLADLKRNNPDAVVVVMTAYADMDMVLAALRAEADDFVVKPINVQALAAVLRRAIDRRNLRADLAALRLSTRARDRFLAHVSHKLNTPLASVLLFLDSLAEESSPARRAALLEEGLPEARKAAGVLGDLIAELLRVAEAVGPEPPAAAPSAPIPLDPILDELAAHARAAGAARGIRVTVAAPVGLTVVAAEDRLRRALRELVDNAVKFNRDGGEVRIGSAPAAAGEAEVRIADTGPGIPEAELPKVFEPFQQVDPGFTGQVPGLGLGLALARRLLEADRGRLVLASTTEGTVATVTLPCA